MQHGLPTFLMIYLGHLRFPPFPLKISPNSFQRPRRTWSLTVILPLCCPGRWSRMRWAENACSFWQFCQCTRWWSVVSRFHDRLLLVLLALLLACFLGTRQKKNTIWCQLREPFEPRQTKAFLPDHGISWPRRAHALSLAHRVSGHRRARTHYSFSAGRDPIDRYRIEHTGELACLALPEPPKAIYLTLYLISDILFGKYSFWLIIWHAFWQFHTDIPSAIYIYMSNLIHDQICTQYNLLDIW